MSDSGRERLERALIRLDRPRRAGRQARPARPVPPVPILPLAAPGIEDSAVGEPPAAQGLPVELLELVDRLDNIADRLADMEQPGRPLPATREIFGEWVRLRKWEEIPFAEFLTLRRAGRV